MKLRSKMALAIVGVLYFNASFAQNYWLSGNHKNGFFSYLKNGKSTTTKVEWTGGNQKEGSVVVYGQFKTGNDQKKYFDIEKTGAYTNLINGTFYTDNTICAVQGATNGYLINEDNRKTYVALYKPVSNGQYIETSKAYWGVKECNGKTQYVYYIHDIHDNNTARVVEPTYPQGASSNTPSTKTESITGKITKRHSSDELDVPNWATFITNDGTEYQISSTSPININSTITLDGYTKETYYNGIMKTEYVFYVTRVR